jgi:TolB-like protein
VPLTPKAFELLVLLVENRGHLLKKDELIERVWPNTFVEEANLAQNISALRKALDDKNGGAQYIETVAKGGYHFTAAVVDHTLVGGVGSHAVEPLSPRFASRVALRRALAFLATASVAVILMLALQRGRLQSSGTPSVPRIQSLSVLPLENLSRDSSQDYFADGMTDALITSLGQIGSLRVISRTSVMQYRGVHKPLPQIARELNVDAVVEGTVMGSSARVRIAAQLIQASTDKHLWSQSYERDLKDVLGLQQEIASAIAKQIRMTLTPGEQIRAGIGQPVNLQAYESYWRGEYFLNRGTPDSIRKAADYFQQAIEKDPNYTAGYTKLAACYQILGNMEANLPMVAKAKPPL